MKSSLSSFRQGLTSGLKESAAWAASAATDLRRATGLVLGGESDPQQGLEDHLDDAQEEHLVVEICSALGLPSTTAFVALCVADGVGALRGRRVTTVPRVSTSDPVWNSQRDLAVEPRAGELLLVEVYSGASSSDLSRVVCSGHVSLDLLREEEPAITIPLRRKLDIRLQGRPAGGQGAGLLTLRRIKWREPAFRRKTVFLIRHGQSRWNEAQKQRRIEKMVAFDHPLTRQGIDEAASLQRRWEAARMAANGETVAPEPSESQRRSSLAPPATPVPSSASFDLLSLGEEGGSSGGAAADASAASPPAPDASSAGSPSPAAGAAAAGGVDRWLHAFLNASLILSSPLTPVQTALVALFLHPTMVARGMTLSRSAREIKGVGSLDSVGKCVGSEILVRAEKMMEEELEDAARARKYMEVDVDVNDTVTEWWTGTDAADSEADVEERLMDLFTSLQFADGSSAIVVGHSLFFREVLRRYSTDEMRQRKPELCARLAEGKLQNGGCLGLEVEWDARGRARIVDADLLFDSKVIVGH